MIDGSKSEPPFCVRSWLKKIEKKIVCRKVLLEKNCLQRCIDKKKSLQREIFHPPPSRKIMVRPLITQFLAIKKCKEAKSTQKDGTAKLKITCGEKFTPCDKYCSMIADVVVSFEKLRNQPPLDLKDLKTKFL